MRTTGRCTECGWNGDSQMDYIRELERELAEAERKLAAAVEALKTFRGWSSGPAKDFAAGMLREIGGG